LSETVKGTQEGAVMADVDLTLAVARLVEEMRKADGPPTEEALNRLATQIAKGFDAHKDEVAILRLSPNAMVLNFVFPIKLSKVGSIPLTLTQSLAAKTIREKRGEIVNTFSGYKHPTIFESVNLSEQERAAPIQKIVSVPMIAEGKVEGVLQISRKARPGEPLGPDFTPKDLAELTMVGSILATYLAAQPPIQRTPPKPSDS
jgi:signal transduction protein with GAF and PtsI domain